MKNKIIPGVIAIGVLFSSFTLHSVHKPKDKPNVLFIAVDDLRPELACYGESRMATPNIDRLARQGILFENAYCQQSICMASRASLLSGIRPEYRKIYNCSSVKELVPEVTTLNKAFENNGYKTYGIGKVYHHAEDHLMNFGEEWFDPSERWAGRGYISDEAIAEMQANELYDPGKKEKGPAWEMADVPDDYYLDGFNTNHAIEKIKENRKSGQPFFMAMGFHKPHLPWCAPKKYWDMYPPETIDLSPVPDVPDGITEYTLTTWGELRGYFGIPQGNDKVPDELAAHLRRAYFACVSYMDAQLGKILDALEENKLMENTIIVLWGDHGWKLGDYGAWSKHTNYTFDTRVPFIISWPGAEQKGVKTESFVEMVDVYPTLCELAMIEIPGHVQGQSLVPVLQDPGLIADTVAWSIFPRDREKEEKTITGFSLRTKNYRYTEWIHLTSGKTMDLELYDVENDPYETRNLRDAAEYFSIRKNLEKALHDHYDAAILGKKDQHTLLFHDPGSLSYARFMAGLGKKPWEPAVKDLLNQADELLGVAPYSVINKKKVPPSGNKHDYYSLGVYWWPDPAAKNGLPYIRKDGYRNPEIDDYDGPAFNAMSEAVFNLSLAYYFSGEEKYALKAGELIRTWFLDPQTRMNPHLDYGQAIPGITEGRGIGIIESETLIYVVEGVGLLEGSAALEEREIQELKTWFRKYTHWLLTSKNGLEERMWHNNHGSAYDAQVAAFSIFTGEDSIAEMVLDSVKLKRIETQIEADGSQPFELERTKAMGYSIYNLKHLYHCAWLAEYCGIDLWNYKNSKGASILTATKFLLPFLEGSKPFPYEQIGGLDGQVENFLPLLYQADEEYNDPKIRESFRSFRKNHPGDQRLALLYFSR